MKYLFLGLFTSIASLLLVWMIRRIALRCQWVVAPREDRWHKNPVALFGGVGIFFAFILGLGVAYLYPEVRAFGMPPILFAFFSGGIVLFISGLIDDRVQLTPFAKLIFQVVAISIPISAGLVFYATPWALLNVIITYSWFLLIINAINLMDNMDGLAASVVMIAALTSIVLSLLQAGSVIYPSFVVAILLFSSTAGFLFFNRHPASIFMGDAGSLFLGYHLAGTIMPNELNNFFDASSVLFSLLVPATILSLPILDTSMVVITRMWRGVSVTAGGKDHTSHRLVGLGLSENRAVLTLCFLAAVGSLLAVLYTFAPENSIILIALYFIILTLIGVYLGRMGVYSDRSSSTQKVWTPLVTNILYKRHVVQIFLDFFLIVLAYYSAYYLRFESSLSYYVPQLIQSLPIVVAACLAWFYVAGVYREIWRLITLRDVGHIIKGLASGIGTSAFVILVLYRFHGYSRAVFFIFAILLFLFMVAARLSFRILDTIVTQRKEHINKKLVVVYGAGQAGRILLEEYYQNHHYQNYKIIGFVDDDQTKHRLSLSGIPIYAPQDLSVSLGKTKKQIQEVWVSSSAVSPMQVSSFIASLPHEVKLLVKIKKFFVEMKELII